MLSRSIHLKIITANTRWERGSSHHICTHTFNSRSSQFQASHTKHQNPRTNSNSLLCFSDMCCSLFQSKILLICELSKEGAAPESEARRAKIRERKLGLLSWNYCSVDASWSDALSCPHHCYWNSLPCFTVASYFRFHIAITMSQPSCS